MIAAGGLVLLILFVLMFQVHSLSGTAMVAPTGPLGLTGTEPALLIFNQPFDFNAILGVIGLSRRRNSAERGSDFD